MKWFFRIGRPGRLVDRTFTKITFPGSWLGSREKILTWFDVNATLMTLKCIIERKYTYNSDIRVVDTDNNNLSDLISWRVDMLFRDTVCIFVGLVPVLTAFQHSYTPITRTNHALGARSKSVPFTDEAPALAQKLPGNVGFDPLFLSSIQSDVSEGYECCT